MTYRTSKSLPTGGVVGSNTVAKVFIFRPPLRHCFAFPSLFVTKSPHWDSNQLTRNMSSALQAKPIVLWCSQPASSALERTFMRCPDFKCLCMNQTANHSISTSRNGSSQRYLEDEIRKSHAHKMSITCAPIKSELFPFQWRHGSIYCQILDWQGWRWRRWWWW